MRKSLLLMVVLAVSIAAVAQKSRVNVKPGLPTESAQVNNNDDLQLTKTPSTVDFVRPALKGTSDITVLNLGNAGNAFGLYNGGRTAVYAEPEINTVTFVHRMLATPGTGYIAYDISKDGGDTWSVNNQIFDPTVTGTANARYPQGLIYNPEGNTNPDDAYLVGFYPTLDGSNAGAGSWGGYASSTVKLDNTGLSQVGWPSDPPIRHNVPESMAINPETKEVFIVEPSLVDGLGTNYTDTLVMTRGTFNSETGAFEYEETPFYAPMNPDASIAECKIAFSPDGQIGYILLLGDNGGDPFVTGLAYYPILYKSTDFGATWGEDPIVVPLGGPDGLDGIVNDLLTDDQIAELFVEPLPARDEIGYTTAFFADLAVDNDGDPVISVVIGVAGSDPFTIVSAGGFFASYNIFGTGQGEDWWARKLGDNLLTFRGEWGDVAEDNRSQITSTVDGTFMFFSWLDTHFEGVTDNLQPDIFCVGWDVLNNMYTEVINVTYLSDAWLQAFMGTAPTYCFELEPGVFEIPFVYQEMDPANTANPVQYKYIKDFILTSPDDFTIVSAGNKKIEQQVVSQNYPNPFSNETKVSVNIDRSSSIGLEVYNLVGQKVYEIPSANLAKGTHQFTIPGKGLKSGVYTYSVIVNGERHTKKMIVK